MRKTYIKNFLKTAYMAGVISLMVSFPAAASVDITIGGADIGAPNEVFSRYEKNSQGDAYSVSNEADNNDVEMSLSGTIKDNIFVGDINISGLTYNQAVNKVEEYVASLAGKEFTFFSVNDAQETISASELGIYWANKDVLKDAIAIGKGGNLIAQYKAVCDLQHNKQVYPLQIGFERESVLNIINKQGFLHNEVPKNANITRENGQFKILPGKTGIQVDVDASVTDVMNKLSSWDGESQSFQLIVKESQPKANEDTLKQLTDVLGTYTTSFKTSNSDRSGNVRTGCRHLDGHLLLPGEQISVYESVSPFTEENGYYMAGSYMNGKVVESLGGGICQVSSTLYNAVIRAELQVDERYPHSMVVTYVDLSSDAAIAGTYKDFKFTNSTDYPIYIEGYTTEDKQITFTIFGHETRPDNRKVAFESVQTSKTEPENVDIIADASHPVGYISTQSAHIGYTGELWKVVTVDGVETERVQVNKSRYNPSPRTVTVGIAAADPGISAAVQGAIATGDVDLVKATIGQLTAAAQAAAGQ